MQIGITKLHWLAKAAADRKAQRLSQWTRMDLVTDRPILEAFWHTKYFTQMMIKYAKELETRHR